MDLVDEKIGDVTLLAVKGRIDTTTAKIFGDKMETLIKSGRHRLVIDLGQTPYISSAGFRALLIGARMTEQANGKFVLCALSADMKRLFDIGAFTDLFVICASRDDAISKAA
jgi:anti-sigma B factor antagonist